MAYEGQTHDGLGKPIECCSRCSGGGEETLLNNVSRLADIREADGRNRPLIWQQLHWDCPQCDGSGWQPVEATEACGLCGCVDPEFTAGDEGFVECTDPRFCVMYLRDRIGRLERMVEALAVRGVGI